MRSLISKFLGMFFIVSCQRYSELSSNYLDRKLSWKETAMFYIHHFHCTFCRRFFRQIKSLDLVAKSDNFKQQLSNHKMSEACRQKISCKLDEETKSL